MKILVVPDIHLKPGVIDRAQGLMIARKFDKAVFLGDFVDDWGRGFDLKLYNKTFDALEDFLEHYPDSLICWGNHDISYIWKEPQSGYSYSAQQTVEDRLEQLYAKYKNNLSFVHVVDNVVFSHAGITQKFINRLNHKFEGCSSMEDIAFTINSFKALEMWQDDSPLWARPDLYTNYWSKGLLQIVGHTPVAFPSFHEPKDILFVDTFSTYQTGELYGNQKFVGVDSETKEWEEVE